MLYEIQFSYYKRLNFALISQIYKYRSIYKGIFITILTCFPHKNRTLEFLC